MNKITEIKPNLFAFGCSYIYGHGLPDCIGKNNVPGPYPSSQGFATHVATDLHKNIVNYGEPGASNKQILWILLNALNKITPNDSVIIQWTYTERNARFQIENKQTKIEKITPWSEDNVSKIYYKHIHTNINDVYSTALYINHAHLVLKDRGVNKVLQLRPPSENGPTTEMKQTFDKLLHSDIELFNKNFSDYQVDKAQDGRHAGLKSNILFANAIVNDYGHILR